MNDSLIKRKRITRIACIIALLLVVVMAGTHGVFAADIVSSGTCGNNLTWTLDSDGVLTIEGSGSMKNYGYGSGPWDSASIKSIVISEGVTSIGSSAFSGCSSLTSITIPDSVTSIGSYAFQDCSSLTSITIPDSVTNIGSSVFSGCSSLTSITIPDSMTYISKGLFRDCLSLTSVTLSKNVTAIATMAFSRCYNLTSITIPNSVTTIEDGAFTYNYNLEEFYIPNIEAWIQFQSLAHLSGEKHLYDNEGNELTNVLISDSVTSIGDYAFSGCSSLTSITIPDSVTSIGSYAFQDCSSLTSITIPDSVTNIGSSAFYNCNNLTNITISEGVTDIWRNTFYNCSSLKSLVIPQNVKSIDSTAFDGLSLEYVEFLGDAPSMEGDVSTASNTWNKNGSKVYNGPLFVVSKDKSGWTVPLWNGCRTAYKGISPEDNSTLNADNYNNNGVEFSLDEASLTASVAGFLGNESGILSIPSRVTKDGTRYTVTGISDIIYPNMTDPVNLSKLIIGKNISSIGKGALDDLADFESLEIVDDNESYKTEKGILYNYDKTEVLRALRNSTQVSLPSSVTTIYSNAFSKCEKLKSVSFPNSLTTIESNVFDGCVSLENVVLPNSLTTIEGYAFKDCVSIKNLLIPNSVTRIGSAIFSGCNSLETLTIPFIGGNTKYGTNKDLNPSYYTLFPLGYLFGNKGPVDDTIQIEQCYKVGYYGNGDYDLYDSEYNTFTLLDGTSSASYYIPTSLRSVTVTGGNLYYGAFYNCSMIEEITLGKDVVFTGERAFYGCSSLERINVNKNNAELASDSNGVLYSKDYKTIKCYPSGKKAVSYQIDSRVEAIDEFAFYNCLNLESLYVPETVTEIPTNSIAYYDLTMFVYRGSAAEAYAKAEDIAYKYIGEGKAKNVRVTSEYNLPVIASGEENGSVIGDYDGVSGVVSDSTVNYDDKKSGLQTVTVTYDGETIETQAVVYDPVKEHFFDFGDVKEIQKSERGLAGMFDGNGRFLGLSEAIVLEGHETVLIPNEVYEEAVEAKLMVIDAKSFAPTGESVEEGL